MEIITTAAVGINMGAYADLENPWIWISLFLMFLCGVFIWMWGKRKKELYELKKIMGDMK